MSGLRNWTDAARYYWALLFQNLAEQVCENHEHFVLAKEAVGAHIGGLKGKRVLDVGCGRFMPLTVMLHSYGCQVTGIDTALVVPGASLLKRCWRLVRTGGPVPFARELAIFVTRRDKRILQALQELCEFPLHNRGMSFVRMDAETLAFQDHSFDAVVSVAVFEHIAQVELAIREIRRVLRPGGVCYIAIHLFTSLSGGHHPCWSDPERVPPWDHLRQRRCYVPSRRNRLRKHEYVEILQRAFPLSLEIIEHGKGDGSALLSPKLAQELGDYSEDELLTRGLVFIGRKAGIGK